MDGLRSCICCTACVEKLQCMYVIVCMYAKTLHRMAWEVYICVFVGYSATFSIIHHGLCALPASRGISWSGCIIRSTMGCQKMWHLRPDHGKKWWPPSCMATPSQNNMIQDVFLYLDRSLSGPPFGSQLSRLSCTGDEDMGQIGKISVGKLGPCFNFTWDLLYLKR